MNDVVIPGGEDDYIITVVSHPSEPINLIPLAECRNGAVAFFGAVHFIASNPLDKDDDEYYSFCFKVKSKQDLSVSTEMSPSGARRFLLSSRRMKRVWEKLG